MADTPELRDPEFEALTDKIAAARGFQCSNYKDKCLRRRILSRMRLRGIVTFPDYARLLDSDASEYDCLIRALTINVTNFFRNPDAFAALDQLVVPALWEGAAPIRIWSAGCSSGEEAYTLAVLLHRLAVERGLEPLLARVRIVATDIDAECIAAAKNGLYAAASVGDTTASVTDRYFTSRGKRREVVPEIREMVDFQVGDMLSDPAPAGGKFNLIVCRNVIIYFTLASQERLFAKFHSALADGGALMLGKVETLLGKSRALFEPVMARERIYRKR